MTDQQLRTFITVIECGSFGKAEELLNISRPGIKKQMDVLESELGFSLLTRSHHGVELTPAGELFFSQVKKALVFLDDAVVSGRNIAANRQTLRISMPLHPHQLLSDIYVEFHSLFPSVQMQLIPYDDNTFLIESLLQNEVDLLECTFQKKYVQPGICYRLLQAHVFRCAVSPGHPLAHKDAFSYDDLIGQKLAIGGRPSEAFLAELEAHCGKPSVSLLSKNNSSDIYNFCYNGGIFISKASFIDYMEPLATIPLRTAQPASYSALFYRKDCSENVRNFLKITDSFFPPIVRPE